MTRFQPLRSAVAVSVLFFTGFTPVASAEPPAGRLLASQCAQCHGTNGNAVSGFESIAGKSASELYEELLEMKYGTEIESIMDRQARGYTDDQLQLIAEYLSTRQSTGGDE